MKYVVGLVASLLLLAVATLPASAGYYGAGCYGTGCSAGSTIVFDGLGNPVFVPGAVYGTPSNFLFLSTFPSTTVIRARSFFVPQEVIREDFIRPRREVIRFRGFRR